MQNLRQQLNPHFLFNTLNNIYTLIQLDPARAQSAVHDLSRLLRYVLYGGSREEVPLQDELDFVREYIELMRIRLPRYVAVKVELQEGVSGMMIAPLMFIPLVENAFKHGVSNDSQSFVIIRILVDGDRVTCGTVNSYFPKARDYDRSGSGIGLANLVRRLDLLYPGKYEFRYGQEGGEYIASLSIDLSKPEHHET
ncbi:MAG TPA: histidine kinase [Candidatus Coprenecus stercorigallinarum]|nr:histidine kinase [Candidatus Coprenecus stercorigallinarum]